MRRRTDATPERASLLKRLRSLLPESRVETFIAATVLLGAVVVPLAVSLDGLDVFRLPKQLAMYTVAILVGAGLAIAVTLRSQFPHAVALRAPLVLTGAALLWTALSAAGSVNGYLSIPALVFALAVASIGLGAALSLGNVALPAVALAVLLPAVVNSVILVLQAFDIWNPWVFDSPNLGRSHKNALLGDTNTVGAYLLAPLILAVVISITTRSRVLRPIFLLAAALTAAGLVLSETRTTLVSAVFALGTLAAVRLRMRSAPVILLVIFGALAASMTYEPLRTRVTRSIESVEQRQVDDATGGRLPAFISAWKMFKDHPITGVGPGGFKFEYLPYRVSISDEYPSVPGLAIPGGPNFGEVHNDHLQFLAEIGLPGYLAVLALIIFVASISLRKADATDELHDTARLLALPLCVGLAVTMLAGFPLQRAASVYTFTVLGAACIAWSSRRHVA